MEKPFIKLVLPLVSLKDRGDYLTILRDGNGTYHFWNKDGSYDGCDHLCKRRVPTRKRGKE